MADLFKYQVTLRTRHNPSYRPGRHMFFGSLVGFALTVFVLTTMLTYLIYLMTQMFAANRDLYSSQGLALETEGKQF